MLENLSAFDLTDSMTTKQVARLFIDGFESQNVLMIASAIKVLAKRGDYDLVCEVLTKYFQDGNSFKLNSGFAVALSQIMIDIRNAAPSLGKLGKKIAKRIAVAKDGLYDIKAYEEDVKANLQESGEQINDFSMDNYKVQNVVLKQIFQSDQK